jgi:hypothetical protein
VRRLPFCTFILALFELPAFAEPQQPKLVVAVLPFHYAGVDGKEWTSFENEVGATVSLAAKQAGGAALRPDQVRQRLADPANAEDVDIHSMTPDGALENCAAKGKPLCAEKAGADWYVSALIGRSDGEVFGFIHLRRTKGVNDAAVMALDGASLNGFRASFKTQASRFLAPLGAPAPHKAALPTGGPGHLLRSKATDTARLAECDDLLIKAMVRREILIAAAQGDPETDKAHLTDATREDAAGADELSPCAKSFGPIYHYEPLVKPGEPVTRRAIGTAAKVTAEQCGDVQDRLSELHDAAKEAAMSGTPDLGATMTSGMVIGVVTAMRDACR